jgi:folate-binding protein YgfZ
VVSVCLLPGPACAGSAIPLEYNLDLLQGVTLSKGCYLGQELVARTHYQGLVRKRVIPIIVDSADVPCKEAALVGCDVFYGNKTKPVGTIRGVCGIHGVAHVRLEAAWDAIKEGHRFEVRVEGEKLSIEPIAPRWWPSDLRPPVQVHLFY